MLAFEGVYDAYGSVGESRGQLCSGGSRMEILDLTT
jgi:hypothetical protein